MNILRSGDITGEDGGSSVPLPLHWTSHYQSSVDEAAGQTIEMAEREAGVVSG